MLNFDKVPKWRMVLAAVLLAAPAIYKSLTNGDGFIALLKSAAGFLILVLIVGGILAAVFVILFFFMMLLSMLLLGKESIERSEENLLLLYSLGQVALALSYIGVCYYTFGGRIHFL